MRILILTKRQYTNKDLLDDRYGRLWHLPGELSKKGITAHGLCLSYSWKEGNQCVHENLEWESINAGRLFLPGLIKYLMKALRRSQDADLIWACSDSFYGIAGYLLSKIRGIPLCFDLYDNFEYFALARMPVIRELYRYVVKRCDLITCVSAPLKELVQSYGRKKKTFVLENGIPKGVFRKLEMTMCRQKLGLPDPSECRIIGIGGSLYKNRGIEIVFDSFNCLKKNSPDIRLALAGPRDIKIPKNAGFIDLGILPYELMPLFYNALDVAVIPNSDDAFGRYCFPQKAREIMACGIPIVAADVGVTRDLFSKDHPEWLYRTGDAEDLSRIIEKRLSDPRCNYPEPVTWKTLSDDLGEWFETLA